MRWKLRKSPVLLTVSALLFLGCLSNMQFTALGDSRHATAPDTCGDYFFLPMFPECNLYLEAVPCFNDTPTVIVTMATPAGETIHIFTVTYGPIEELFLVNINQEKHEGLVVRSTGDISLYVHKTSGDSMAVYPIDCFARDYEIPRLMSLQESSRNGSSSTPTTTSATTGKATSHNHNNNNNSKYSRSGALYVFSPFNNTSISLTQLPDIIDSTSSSPSKSPSSSSSSTTSSRPSWTTTTFKLDAFEIHTFYIDLQRRYRVHSNDVFAVVLVQTLNPFVPNDTLCQDAILRLLDFVPPYAVRAKYYYIAFPKITDFTVFVLGQANTTLDVTTDLKSKEITLDQSGTNISDVTKTSSMWISASQPISVYVMLTICSNVTSTLCGDNGFFLPSVEQYFSCQGNRSKDGCVCTCPSVFQWDIDPHSFHFFRNASESRPTSIYPLLVGELFDVSTSISNSKQFKDAQDIIVTSNTSFNIFRYDPLNLNFLPAGSALANIYSVCSSESYNLHFRVCDDTVESPVKSEDPNSKQDFGDSNSAHSQCSCEFIQDAVSFSVGADEANALHNNPGTSGRKVSIRRGGGGGGDSFTWVEDAEDTTRPLIAVVVSLCVSIFAVIALISGYMLVEMVSRRKHVRNTKIRPFVS